jgi:cytochrome P450
MTTNAASHASPSFRPPLAWARSAVGPAPDGLPPGPPLPPSLQTLLFLLRPTEFLSACHRRYGDVFTMETLLFGVEVAMSNPADIRQIFTGDPDTLRAGEANALLEPLLGPRSLLLLDGPAHARMRRLMMPPFHGERMLSYGKTMQQATARVVAGWPRGEVFSLHPSMQRITLDIILRTIFGADDGDPLDDLHRALAELLDRVTSSMAAVLTLPPLRRSLLGLSPWAAFLRARARTDALVHRQIARRREGQRAGRDDVLTLLLDARDEQGQPLSDGELRDELMTLLVAGHETTATMLCWALDLLLSHPAALDRLLAELRSAGRGGEPVPPPDELAKLPYLDAVIKESLRLRPVIPAVGRRLTVPMTLRGRRMPAGTLLIPSAYAAHHRDDVYPDPTAFRPERFVDQKPDPYAWFPFGGGARRCLGIAFALFEMKVVLGTVLSTVALQKKRPAPSRILMRSFTFAPERGVEVRVSGAASAARATG